MNYSDETLMAYLDDELDAATRAAVDAAAAADPELARRIARQRALRTRLRAAFDPILAEPVPARLRAVLEPEVADAPMRTPRRTPSRWPLPHWAALAASLIVGALLGPLLVGGRGAPELQRRDGALVAGGALARALDTQLASTQPRDVAVSIGVSFMAKSGDYCRSFTLQATQPLAGVACRGGTAWQLEVLARAPAAPAAPGGFRPAATALPAGVLAVVEQMRAGEPLDAAGEAAARARNWGR